MIIESILSSEDSTLFSCDISIKKSRVFASLIEEAEFFAHLRNFRVLQEVGFSTQDDAEFSISEYSFIRNRILSSEENDVQLSLQHFLKKSRILSSIENESRASGVLSKISTKGMKILDGGDSSLLVRHDLPYEGVSEVTGFVLKLYGSKNVKVEFKWSKDNKNFSPWYDNFDEFKSTLPLSNPLNKFWVEYRISPLSSNQRSYFSSIQLTTNLSSEYAEKKCICSSSSFQPPRLPGNPFKPYDVANAAKFQQKMSYLVNSMFGIDVKYCKIEGNKETADFFLNEYTQYNSDENLPMTCLKVMVNENQFPDARISYTPFGLDFEMPFEIHIDKNYFEETYGHGKMPQKRDIVLIPMMNRFYEVQSSTLVKDFMQLPLYYSCALIKYSPKPNVVKAPEVEETLLKYTKDAERLFGEEVEKDRIDAANPQQFGEKSRYHDSTRAFIDHDQWIEHTPLKVGGTTVFEFFYDNSKMFESSYPENKVALSYLAKFDFTDSSSIMFGSWFNGKQTVHKVQPSITILASQVGGFYQFDFGKKVNDGRFTVGGWVEITSASNVIPNLILYGKISEIEEFRIKVSIPPEIIAAAVTLDPNWMIKTNFAVYPYSSRVLISNWNAGKGFFVDNLGLRFWRVYLNNQPYVFDIGNLLFFEKWYAVGINISNEFKELRITFWKTPLNERSTKLDKIITRKISLTQPLTWTDQEIKECSLYSGELQLGNIRLMKYFVQEEEQSKFFMQEFTTDASGAYIFDGAAPPNRLPFLGR